MKHYIFELWSGNNVPPKYFHRGQPFKWVDESVSGSHRAGYYRYVDYVEANDVEDALHYFCDDNDYFDEDLFEEHEAEKLVAVTNANGRLVWEKGQKFYDFDHYTLIAVAYDPKEWDDDLVRYFKNEGIIEEETVYRVRIKFGFEVDYYFHARCVTEARDNVDNFVSLTPDFVVETIVDREIEDDRFDRPIHFTKEVREVSDTGCLLIETVFLKDK